METKMWIEDNLLGKVISPVSGFLALIPDTFLSIAGKLLLAIALAGVTFLTNKLLEMWWNRKSKKKR